MRIKKTSQYIEGGASLSNVYGTSNENGYTQEYINNLETYSTDEIRIGTWIDGKPLYRKVIESTNISSDMRLNISDLDLIINVYGTAIRNPGSYYNLPRLNKSNINGQIGFYYTNNELHIEIGTDVTNVTKIIVVIEYTKTTD